MNKPATIDVPRETAARRDPNTAALARHLLPEHSPPAFPAGLFGLCLLLAVLSGALAGLLFSVGLAGGLLGLLPTTALALAAWRVSAQAALRRRKYEALYEGAKAMAERLATGKARVGETTEGLLRLAAEVEATGSTPAGWFFFVFW